MIQELKNRIINGYKITKIEALELYKMASSSKTCLDVLCNSANEIRYHYCGNSFDLCTIVNGKCGRCSEDCRYCAQSAHYPVDIESSSMLDTDQLLAGARYNEAKGILRYSIVTSGRTLTDNELNKLCKSYKNLHENTNISLCASHGLLNYEQFVKLKNSGVSRYHNNLETSKRNFPNICTTHTYDDKISTIKDAQRAGLSVCCGGIMGLGETMEDRISMALDLRELGIKSVPINILTPIPHTPFENNPVLHMDEVNLIVAIFRFILPDVALRLAGGRNHLPDKGFSAFQSGANATISGDMLTTSGINKSYDIDMITKLGFKPSKI